ncbi:polysaccharide deacetylase family protein [Micromonospora sp. AMSO31t]|uniref:polysaccharide deacetylase family protein n=1 Tax=Micromonospora sp. AMSO31t TaxID=2650566 RepID=UPI00124B6D89|nr:polysaccharide deacetylase family protein [Micromonospora sp. AMSO31t]KAB1916275.1 polysaccharide deacetylase family protein [Micromonospora sp. AMSO31t]
MSVPGATAQVLAAAATGLAVAHGTPALAAIGPLRRRLLPATAGIGHPAHVALTFDDGPHPEATPELLRLLDSAGIRATFFLVGEMAQQHPSIARAIAAAGHEIGVHGYEHRLLLTRRPAETRADLTRATSVISELTGATPRWWRPPYGVASTAGLLAARRLGLTPVLWSCWGRDWTSRATPDSIFRAVRRGLTGGATILLHDSDHYAAQRSWKATLGALPKILTTCRARGLNVGPLGEHEIIHTALQLPFHPPR